MSCCCFAPAALQNDWNDHLCHACLNHRINTSQKPTSAPAYVFISSCPVAVLLLLHCRMTGTTTCAMSASTTGTALLVKPTPAYAFVCYVLLCCCFKLQNDWNDHLCHECLNHRDGTAVECDGTCLRMFHMQCLPPHLRPKPTDAPDAPWWVM
jgi:hypothetical protein